MPQVHVAIGLIVDAGRVLICRRAQGDRFEHCWEFPGGKVEANESPHQCIHREMQEELGVTVRIISELEPINHDYTDLGVCLHPFALALDAGTPRPLASREVRWVTADEITEIPFPEANANLIRNLPTLLRALGLVGH